MPVEPIYADAQKRCSLFDGNELILLGSRGAGCHGSVVGRNQEARGKGTLKRGELRQQGGDLFGRNRLGVRKSKSRFFDRCGGQVPSRGN